MISACGREPKIPHSLRRMRRINKLIKRLFPILLMVYALSADLHGQTQNDTIFNFFTAEPVTIDGSDSETCWSTGAWHAIDQVWMPWGAAMNQGDFEGRFKVTWDSAYLYVLVEIVDDSLSDDYTNPLSNWWNDDCLEIFIDEDRSMGDHERTCNAFAYHVSLFYDAIDLDATGNGINYKDHIDVVMDTIGEDRYLWEMAIKIYNETYDHSNPDASREYLYRNKKMGLAVAYCDNDETTTRENFIGSMYMTQANNNEMYKNADYFGLMILSDPEHAGPAGTGSRQYSNLNISPVPAKEQIYIQSDNTGEKKIITVYTLTGLMVKSEAFVQSPFLLDISDLVPAPYIIRITGSGADLKQVIIKE